MMGCDKLSCSKSVVFSTCAVVSITTESRFTNALERSLCIVASGNCIAAVMAVFRTLVNV